MAVLDRANCRSAVEALARHYSLAIGAGGQLEVLVELLAADPFAPTAVREPTRVVDDHIADALVALDLPAVRLACTIADLGSGAGVPGLALAIALPEAEVFLVESAARKCEFLRRAVAACGVKNACVVHARAETWRSGLGRLDAVTARAVGAPAVVAEYAAPLLRIGGTLVVWRGRRDPSSERAARSAAAELGLQCAEPRAVHPYPEAEHRHLQLMFKVSSTPSGFPRRPGLAVKRPLGGSLASGRDAGDRGAAGAAGDGDVRGGVGAGGVAPRHERASQCTRESASPPSDRMRQ